MERIYVDHNATTPLDPAVLEAMLPYLTEQYGNASSVHWMGQEARRAVDRARRQVAQLVGGSEAEIVFVSGGTEADNLALRGAVRRFRRLRPGVTPHLVTTAIEHPAVLSCCAQLEAEGVRVTRVEVDHLGMVSPRRVAEAIDEDTALVAVMLANNDVGTIQPVAEIARLARSRGVPVHCDAVQAGGRIPIDVDQLGVDTLALSAHKLHGPKGSGALYVRRGLELPALIAGGDQELRRRGGTENVAGIVGFGCACELAAASLDERSARLRSLRDRLEQRLVAALDGVEVNGDPVERLPNTSSVTIAGIEGAAAVINLDLAGIAASVGSACASGRVDPSHVLLAMGRRPEQALATLRFSLGRDNDEPQVDRVAREVVQTVGQLRSAGAERAEEERYGRRAG